MNRFAIALPVFVYFLTPQWIANAGDADWPQWRGANRDGHAAPQELLQNWPTNGPKLKWEFSDAGPGYSAVAVVDDRLYTLGSTDTVCFALCLNIDDGSEIWRSQFSRAGNSDDYNLGWGGGPRSTPTVDGDQIFVLSDVGTLACLNRSDGEVQWKTELVSDHGGRIPTWGYSESPLVDGDRVVVTPGKSNFMIAVDRHRGQKVWRSKGFDQGAQYVSIMKGSVDARSFYVTASKQGLVAFDTGTGDQVFADPTTSNGTAVIPTPIVDADRLYHTSGYGAGNTLLRLRGGGQSGVRAESVYHLAAKSMENHHGGVVLVDGTIYGFSKTGGGTWMAQDLQSGQVLWSERIRPNRSGSICYADGRLYCYNDKDGSLYLIEPSRKGWIEKGKLTLPRQTDLPRGRGAIWAHPVVASGTLVIRDQELIFAFDIRRK